MPTYVHWGETPLAILSTCARSVWTKCDGHHTLPRFTPGASKSSN